MYAVERQLRCVVRVYVVDKQYLDLIQQARIIGKHHLLVRTELELV